MSDRQGEEIPEYELPEAPVRDAIGEEDNPIPAWWWWTFLGTVVFALVYIPYYTLSGWSQEGQYREQVARAEALAAQAQAERPATNPYSGDAAAIAEGQEVFATVCAACHKPDATGLVGPSLVDPYWKYGSNDPELFESVAEGRPAGMPGWQAQLGEEKIWKVLAYLESLPQRDEPGVGAPAPAGSGGAPSAQGPGSDGGAPEGPGDAAEAGPAG